MNKKNHNTHLYTGRNLSKLADILNINDGKILYEYFVSTWKDPNLVTKSILRNVNKIYYPDIYFNTLTEQMMAADSINYLPYDILVKLDRASMGVSLESRVPFLDHRIVEFSWRLPLSMKIRGYKESGF